MINNSSSLSRFHYNPEGNLFEENVPPIKCSLHDNSSNDYQRNIYDFGRTVPNGAADPKRKHAMYLKEREIE